MAEFACPKNSKIKLGSWRTPELEIREKSRVTHRPR